MLIHWIWLATRPGMNDRQKVAALAAFRDPEEVFFSDASAIAHLEDLTEEGRKSLMDKNLTEAEKILQTCIDKNIHICTFHDVAYPSALKNIADPPVALYYKGHLPDLEGSPVIGVVGTRKASGYGMKIAKQMGFQIARCGGIVVSGAASGIDGESMRGALTAGGNVIAVLGCGADVVYPASNRSLYADTERYGCLLTEFVPGTRPLKWNFPKRNRIISGLSNGVLVVEAPFGSGALITANRAADQGRDVFVVPGNVDTETCMGSNALLRDGAISVTCGWDVVSEYEALYPGKIRKDLRPVHLTAAPDEVMSAAMETEKIMPKVAQKPRSLGKNKISGRKKEEETIDNGQAVAYSDQSRISELSEQERKIVAAIRGVCLVDEVTVQTGLGTPAVLQALTALEIKGVVKKLPGNRVTLK